jgi:hypothetical protein
MRTRTYMQDCQNFGRPNEFRTTAVLRFFKNSNPHAELDAKNGSISASVLIPRLWPLKCNQQEQWGEASLST